MLCPVVVHLQRQNTARLDHNAFNLKTLPGIDTIVGAPRAVHLAVDAAFRSALLLEDVDNFFDILGVVLVCYQDGISRFHDHQIAHTHAGDEPTF